MKAVVQRVNSAVLRVDDQEVSRIGQGLVCYLGVGKGDTEVEMKWLARKIAGLRVFSDEQGKMNLSSVQIGGDILVVSQFTLFGDIRNGFRPSFTDAEAPEAAKKMYEDFCQELQRNGVKKVAQGVFAADMNIVQENQGPVTIILDSSTRKL